MVKYIVSRTYKPWLVQYLSKKRMYRYKTISLEVPPEVFHPAFFSSTRLLLNYISSKPLADKKVLELGAGSGLLSFYAAKKRSRVTATDINPVSVNYLFENKKRNQIEFEIFLSDLFDNIPQQQFDLILINPPYYKKKPALPIEYAWYCGEEGEYFQKLFQQLSAYTHAASEVIMVLCDGCDIEMVQTLAEKNGLQMICKLRKPSLIENNYIFKIEPVSP